MKISLKTALILALLLICRTNLSAQIDTSASEAPRLGLGVSLLPYTFPNNDTYLVQPAGALTWYVPAQFGKYFRCEVEFAYSQSNDSLPLTLTGNIQSRNFRSSSFARVGVGVYYTHPFDAQTRLYGGLRSGVVTSSVYWETFLVGRPTTTPFVYDEGIGSFWYGGVLGFEYMLSRHIAIAGEAHLTAYSTGASYSARAPIPADYPIRFPVGRTSDAVLTSANVALRFFF